MDLGGANWAVINIVGPLILAAVLLWVFLRSRRSRDTDERTEEATRRLYDEEDEEHRGEDDYVP
jgi:cbb3-type cytochrome oxidase maturation protein